jgi:hypothetical protein
MLLAGRQTHNNIELFYGFEGVFMGSLWKVKILWVWIMGVTIVYLDLIHISIQCISVYFSYF